MFAGPRAPSDQRVNVEMKRWLEPERPQHAAGATLLMMIAALVFAAFMLSLC